MPKINEIGKNLPTKVTKIYFMNNQLHLEIHTWENYLLPMFVRFSSRIQELFLYKLFYPKKGKKKNGLDHFIGSSPDCYEYF